MPWHMTHMLSQMRQSMSFVDSIHDLCHSLHVQAGILSNEGYIKTIQLSSDTTTTAINTAVLGMFSEKLPRVFNLGWHVLCVKMLMRRLKGGTLLPRKGASSQLQPLKHNGELAMEHIKLCILHILFPTSP